MRFLSFLSTPPLGTETDREITYSTFHLPPDVAIALGVACGALVYLTRTHEPTNWRKGIYFTVSLIGGYFVARWELYHYPRLEPWLAGFASSAALVTLAVLTLDWSERHVEPALDTLFNWLIKRLPKE
ncbi:putative holin [Burkholderia ubonensis]|uniref:putative holin n=1 Tax=Burkholderia ubonensis TaxID=101571 RepID=UPI00075DF4E0|nr:putative holin [Burkholderia ubonensis]KVK96210.1 hypothetical protein WJ45_20030 [Burkholderia ubonensis]KVQ44341.1 hypothetical protein WK04_15535 [Burkholderia ubonensis]